MSACAVVIDISDKTASRYDLSPQDFHARTMLIYVLQAYVSWFSYHCWTLTVHMLSVIILTRSSVIAMDLGVIVLTWIKTFGHWRRLRQLHINVSVTDVLIRDGMYSLPD